MPKVITHRYITNCEQATGATINAPVAQFFRLFIDQIEACSTWTAISEIVRGLYLLEPGSNSNAERRLSRFLAIETDNESDRAIPILSLCSLSFINSLKSDDLKR